MFIGLVIMAIIGVAGIIKILVKPDTYGSKLESYITGNNPQSPVDVERLSREFDQKTSKGIL